mgnify:CR=1 FL=1|tara:strand:- start:1322 stop:1543 length:222 start_codon:yes stop_codon:yes gene_type:complete
MTREPNSIVKLSARDYVALCSVFVGLFMAVGACYLRIEKSIQRLDIGMQYQREITNEIKDDVLRLSMRMDSNG